MHKHGVVYRSAKPDHFLYDANSKKFLMVDLGGASTINETVTYEGGSWSYYPPEVIEKMNHGESFVATNSIDMWQFGVVMTFVATGTHPFKPERGLTIEQIKHSILFHKNGKQACAICLETFDNDFDHIEVTTLPCGHTFHKSCTDKWAPTSQRMRDDGGVTQPTCPMCKRPFDLRRDHTC